MAGTKKLCIGALGGLVSSDGSEQTKQEECIQIVGRERERETSGRSLVDSIQWAAVQAEHHAFYTERERERFW